MPRGCEPANGDVELLAPRTPGEERESAPTARAVLVPPRHARPLHAVPLLMTGAAVLLAGLLAWAMWDTYVLTPWTRDGAVRAYVVEVAPEVSGRIVRLPVAADEYVHAGDTLMEIEQSDYSIATSHAEAALESAQASLVNASAEAERRQRLSNVAVSAEEQQRFRMRADIARANRDRAQADLAQARLNLQRTRIVSPVSGYITNLTSQVGDYAMVGHRALTVVNAESFWVDGYFEETQLGDIHLGDPATISLMGYRELVRGHVVGISRGIQVANAQSDQSGLQTVNPVYTWIRLAQRVPVRIAIDQVPESVTLVAGLTATVQIEQGHRHRASIGRVTPAAGALPPARDAR